MYSKKSALDTAVLDGLREMSGEMGEFFVSELVQIFTQQVSEKLPLIAQALQENDRKKVASETHSLKSSSANLGALQFMVLCGSLEKWGRGFAEPTFRPDQTMVLLENEWVILRTELIAYVQSQQTKSKRCS